MDNKSKRVLKIVTIVLWCVFMGICFIKTNNKIAEMIWAISVLCILVAAIVCSIKLGKTNSKKDNYNKVVDDNVLKGREIYNTLVKKFFKKYLIVAVLALSVLLPFIIYYTIRLNWIMVIAFSGIACFSMLVVLAIEYILIKPFYFPYQEILFEGETYVLFLSKSDILDRGYKPCFHVVYQGKEYTQFGRETWVGANDWSDVLISTLHELQDWFDDKKFSNYMRINVKTNQKKVQCVYKFSSRKFLVTDQLEKLKGCFETSRSQLKKEKLKKKQAKKKK